MNNHSVTSSEQLNFHNSKINTNYYKLQCDLCKSEILSRHAVAEDVRKTFRKKNKYEQNFVDQSVLCIFVV